MDGEIIWTARDARKQVGHGEINWMAVLGRGESPVGNGRRRGNTTRRRRGAPGGDTRHVKDVRPGRPTLGLRSSSGERVSRRMDRVDMRLSWRRSRRGSTKDSWG
jgi:hypothetical protein